MQTQPARFSVVRRVRSFGYAWAGVWHLVRSQHNAWVHAVVTAGVVALGVGLKLTGGEWCWIIIAVAGVWGAEAFNTAIEALCDVACPTVNPQVKVAKDVAAAGVLFAALGAAGVGLIVFVPHVLILLRQGPG